MSQFVCEFVSILQADPTCMKTISFFYWIPRILCIAAILFISIFALDSFEPGHSLGWQLQAFLIHLLPSFFMLILLMIAWKREWLGGLLFALSGLILSYPVFRMNYAMNHSVMNSLSVILMITVPFILTGVLFLVSHYLGKQRN